MKLKRLFSLFALCLLYQAHLRAQDCADALDNPLCAETPQPIDTLLNTPFINGCLNVQQSAIYSFHTNNMASAGEVSIDLEIVDCDYTTAGNTDSVFIMVVPLPVGGDPCDPPANASTYCQGDSASFSFSLTGLADDQDYIVIAGSNHSSTYGPCAFTVNISGTAVDITASVTPLLVSLGEPAGLLVEGADPSATVTWTPSEYLDNANSTNPEVYAEETTSFQVTGMVGGCEVTDVVTLNVGPPVDIYNTFTPNGDGINDTWRIKYIERFTNCQVEVFDRWGQSIFKSVGYAQQWDGTYKGRYLPTGPYYYVLELNSLEVTIPPLTGVVSIVH